MNNIKSIFALSPKMPRHPPTIIGEDVERLTGRHFPSMILLGEHKTRQHKSCHVCYSRGKQTAKGQPLKTVYICRFCPSEPGLHPDQCFEMYHALENYSV